MSLVVCPTPIGNLEDVTLRVLSALREADVVACEDTRRTRTLLDRYGVSARLVSYHEHNEQQRAHPSWSSGCRRATRWRWSPTRACRWCPTPATCSCGRASRPASRSRCCPGRRPRWPRWWPRRCPRTGGASPASCRASAASCTTLLGEAGGTLIAFESPRRVPATLALLAELDPARQTAVCRELTKVHEEVVRGSADELAERFAGAPPKGEVVLVIGPATEQAVGAGEPEGLAQLRALVEAGAKPRPAAAGGGRAHRRQRESSSIAPSLRDESPRCVTRP